jgi:hypothetical protein
VRNEGGEKEYKRQVLA